MQMCVSIDCRRSPMCKLIATEELWLLLDALQEPVPEEVHQHLENINTSSTPLLVSYLHHPSLVSIFHTVPSPPLYTSILPPLPSPPLQSPGSISIRTAAVVATAPPTTNSAEEEEQTKCKTPSLLGHQRLNSLRFKWRKKKTREGWVWLVRASQPTPYLWRRILDKS